MIFKDFYSNGTFSGQGNLLIENLLTTYLADPSNAAKLALAMSDTNSNTKERDPARDDVDPKTQQGDDREQVDPKKQQGDQDRVETKSAETDTDDRTQKS